MLNLVNLIAMRISRPNLPPYPYGYERGVVAYFMFRYTPYLYKFDEGYAEIYNNKGTFYKEK